VLTYTPTKSGWYAVVNTHVYTHQDGYNFLVVGQAP
jgi:hypothetical protein